MVYGIIRQQIDKVSGCYNELLSLIRAAQVVYV